MENKTAYLTTLGIFAAIIFVLGMTPIGLIPLGFINLTIVHIPVIVGSMVMKRKHALVLGATFGLASTLAAFGMSFAAQSGLAAALLAHNALAVIIMCFVPRLAIPITTKLTYTAMCKLYRITPKGKVDKKLHSRAVMTAAVVGSFTNTVLYLGMMGMFLAMYGMWGKFTGILTATLCVGAVCEAIAAALIANAVVPVILRGREHKYEIPESNAHDDKEDDTDLQLGSCIDEFNVAVIPAMDSLLPVMDDNMKRKHDRCMKYMEDDNFAMAGTAFDAFIKGITGDENKWKAYVYVIMRFIEYSKYASAAERLAKLMRTDLTTILMTSENKHIMLGIMNIIRASVVNDAINHVKARQAEALFTEATDLVMAERTEEAADKLIEYLEMLDAKDRVIQRVEESINYEANLTRITSPAGEEVNPIVMRTISDDEGNIEEGISERDVAVIKTAAAVSLPAGKEPSRALRLLSVGANAEAAFDEFVASVGEDEKLNAQIFVMLTYFENNDYVMALRTMIKMLNCGYSEKTISDAGVTDTINGILTVVHASMRLANPEKTQVADRAMEKAKGFFNTGAYVLSAQMLDKYFLLIGLAK